MKGIFFVALVLLIGGCTADLEIFPNNIDCADNVTVPLINWAASESECRVYSGWSFIFKCNLNATVSPQDMGGLIFANTNCTGDYSSALLLAGGPGSSTCVKNPPGGPALMFRYSCPNKNSAGITAASSIVLLAVALITLLKD